MATSGNDGMGNGRDGIENASVSAFHNVNLCFGSGLLLLGLAIIQTRLAIVQTGLCHWAVKLWTDIHTLPNTNLLHRNTSQMRKFRKQHHSPLYQVADALKNIVMEELETINPFTLAPWEK